MKKLLSVPAYQDAKTVCLYLSLPTEVQILTLTNLGPTYMRLNSRGPTYMKLTNWGPTYMRLYKIVNASQVDTDTDWHRWTLRPLFLMFFRRTRSAMCPGVTSINWNHVDSHILKVLQWGTLHGHGPDRRWKRSWISSAHQVGNKVSVTQHFFLHWLLWWRKWAILYF